jgi:hypothetical protein
VRTVVRGHAVWQSANITQLPLLETAAIAKVISFVGERVGSLVKFVCDLIRPWLQSVWSFFVLIEGTSIPARLSGLLIMALRVAGFTNTLAEACEKVVGEHELVDFFLGSAGIITVIDAVVLKPLRTVHCRHRARVTHGD